jgi:TonB-linked SusC/RagA family outer membrane protein
MALVAVTAGAYAQSTVSGVVTSAADNEPLIGVTVQVVGTSTGVSTDIDGAYTIKADKGQTLRFSYIGMVPQDIKVTTSTLNVVMSENSNVLDEVVVVGYGAVRRSDLTSSISTVKGEEITEMTTGNAMDALQGKVNGVQITSGGGPGTQPRVIIRGITTVNGSSPLYVVDGMPVGNDINFLNPSDIESMEVLKDASASAIYGTRGSNGVILITTKKGSAGKINVNFSASAGFQTIGDPNMAGASEYEKVYKARYTNDGRQPQWNSPYENYTDDMGTDWWNTVVNKTALVQNYQLGISGGTDKYTFSASLGYFRNNSQYDVGYWDKLTVNLNTEYKFNKYVQAGLQIAPRSESWEDTPSQFGSAMAMDPTTPVLKAPEDRTDNSYNDYVRSYNNQVWNPMASLARPANRSRNYGVLLNPYLQIVPIDGLTLRTQFGLNGVVTRTDSYTPAFSIDALEQNILNSVDRRMYENVDWNWTNTANYMKTFNKVHNLNVMVGFTAEKFGYWNVEGYGQSIPNDSETLRELDAATTGMKAYGTTTYNTLVSYLGRVMYNFDQRYYITASVRVDGSSRFPKGNKYATFPSVSGAWRVSEEHFMDDMEWLDNLKIRAGWGKVGNQAIGNSDYISLLSNSYTVLGGDRVAGSAISSVGNTNLKWETVEDWNVGVDLSVLNSRLNVTADFYRKRSHDMLYKKNVFKYMGYPSWPSSVMMNIGEMQAQGWELGITWRDRVGELGYEVGLNLSAVRNKAIKLTGDGPIDGTYTRSEDGGLIGRFFGYKTDGLFQNWEDVYNHTDQYGNLIQPDAQPGDIKFLDLNGDGSISEADRTYLGNPYPDLNLGLNISLNWRDWDLSANFYGTFGNDIYNTTRSKYSGTNGENVFAGTYDKAWHGEGTSYDIPRLSVNDSNMNYSRVSDFFIEDGSYFRCKLLQLGYTLPRKLIKGYTLRFSFSAQNLFTFTKYSGMDPERPSLDGDVLNTGIDTIAYPNPRTFLFGFNFNF